MPRAIFRHERLFRGLLFSLLLLAGTACGTSQRALPPTIVLNDGHVDIQGLPTGTLRVLRSLDEAQWPSVFRVATTADGPAMLGTYTVDGDVVRFSPAFPFDDGRDYQVRFDPMAVPGASSTQPPLVATVGRPAEHTEPTTSVANVFPTSTTIPENILRMYVEFSAPMGRKSGVEYISLLDHAGKVIPGAVLPLDYEFWSPDHRRFTVFFDPGRVKQGILPNREMGRAFTPGQTVTLVISREWRDEHGLPLTAEYRRTYEVTPADAQPLDPNGWRISAPPSATRTPVTVTFPKPLDHSLLQRAIGIRRDGQAIEGEVEIGPGETTWRFTPRQPWTRGTYQVLTLDVLEDVAGNQVGRAFEVDNFDTVDKDPDPKSVVLPFTVQ